MLEHMVQTVKLVDRRIEQSKVADESHQRPDGDLIRAHKAYAVKDDDDGPQRAQKHHAWRVNGP